MGLTLVKIKLTASKKESLKKHSTTTKLNSLIGLIVKKLTRVEFSIAIATSILSFLFLRSLDYGLSSPIIIRLVLGVKFAE